MGKPADKTVSRSRTRWGLPALCTILCALLLLHVWLRIETHLVYSQQSPIFITTLGFFESFLARPGGIIEYAAAFASQSYYIDWLGALTITAAVAGLCLASRSVIGAVTGREAHFIFYLAPAAAMLLLCNLYHYNMTPTFALLAALSLTYVYCRFAPESFAGSLGMFGAISPIAYYLVGGTYVVLAVLCAVFELLNRRRYLLGAICLVFTAGIPYLYASVSYETLLPGAFNLHLPYSGGMPPRPAALVHAPAIIQLSLLAYVPLACIVLGIAPRRLKTVERSWKLRWSLMATTLGIMVGLGVFTFDAKAKTRLRIALLAEQGDWNLLLAEAHKLPADVYDIYVTDQVNRALSHTGQLAEKMFHYPHGTGYPTLFMPYLDPEGQLSETYANIYFELGHVNRAQHMTHAALEAIGPQPRLLKRLAQINILNGKTQAAKTFLNAMGKHLLFRDEANEYLAALDADPLNARDPQLSRIRQVMLRKDFYYFEIASASYEDKLLQLLDSNPNDRVAFEYLMARYLIKAQIEKVDANLVRLESFGYRTTPTPYQEAAMLFLIEYKQTNPQIPKYIDRATVKRFQSFRHDLRPFVIGQKIDKQSAGPSLADKYGQSYFFYDLFGFSVAPTGGKLKQTVSGASK